MKSIIGIGNALTDILAIIPDESLLESFHLPKGSMQHIDRETGERIWRNIRELDIHYVAGGCSANTISSTALLGMKSAFIGKTGDDEIGQMYRKRQEEDNIDSILLKGKNPSGRSTVLICGDSAERTFAVYLGAALELEPEDLIPEYFNGYDYCHIEGYLVQNRDLIRKAARLAHEAGCIVSMDLSSYNVVEQNNAFLHDIIGKYVDIVFANEAEAPVFTGKDPEKALDEISKMCDIAVVKLGAKGSMVKSGNEYHFLKAYSADAVDATGAGDNYAAGFLYAHSLGMPLETCINAASVIAAKTVEVIGTKLDSERWEMVRNEISRLTSH